jgi:hypothetical protein
MADLPFSENTLGTFGSEWKPGAPPPAAAAPGQPGDDPNSTANAGLAAVMNAARSENARNIATGQGHPGYVSTGFTGNLADRWDGADEESPLSRQNSRMDAQYESQFGPNAIGPHVTAARRGEDYHNLTQRQLALQNHAADRVESADFVHKSMGLDPQSPTFLADWAKLAAAHPGATGEMVKDTSARLFAAHNQVLTQSGKGWEQMRKDLNDKKISQDEVKNFVKPDGSIDYAGINLLATQRTGTKEAGKDESSQQRMYHASLGELKALKAEKSSSLADEGTPEAKALDANIAWHQAQIDSYIKAHPVNASKETTPTAKGPSAEFLATAGGGQVPSKNVIKASPGNAAAVPAQPAASTTLVNKYQ